MKSEVMKVMLDAGAILPKKAHKGDAGYDLFSPRRVVIPPHGIEFVDTGVHIQLPPGKCALELPKSGLLKDHAVLSIGLIDEPYRGAIGVVLINLGGNIMTFAEEEKISQFCITDCYDYELEIATELDETERGSGGFGSTGRR